MTQLQSMIKEVLGDILGDDPQDMIREIARVGLLKRLDRLMYACGEMMQLNDQGREMLAVEIENRIQEGMDKYAGNPYAPAQYQLMRDVYEAFVEAWTEFDRIRKEKSDAETDQAAAETDG